MGLDIGIAVLLVIAFGFGWSRGLLRAVLMAVAVAVALVAAVKLSSVASFWLRDQLHLPAAWLPLLSLVAVFTGVLLLFTFLGRLVEGLLEVVAMGWLNRSAGALLYTAVAAMLLSTVLWYTRRMEILPEKSVEGSALVPPMLSTAPVVIEGAGLLVPVVRDSYARLNVFFDQVAEQATPTAEESL